MIPEEDSRKLVIVLEPEAASIYCRSLDIQQFVNHEHETKGMRYRTGEKIMVIDAGGMYRIYIYALIVKLSTWAEAI